jgi:hypothetical protein
MLDVAPFGLLGGYESKRAFAKRLAALRRPPPCIASLNWVATICCLIARSGGKFASLG